MISRFSLRLLTSFNRRLIINESKRAFSTSKIYRTVISPQKAKPNLKLGYKFEKYSTVHHQLIGFNEEEEPERDRKSLSALEYYMDYMKNNEDYDGSIFDIETVRLETKDSEKELLLAFRNLISDESQMTEESIVDFKNKLIDEKSWLNYYELTEVIHDVIHNKTLHSEFKEQAMGMLNILDFECYERFNENTVDQNLCLAQVFLGKPFKHHFNDKFLFKCKLKYCYKIKRMSRTQTVVLFYLVVKQRNFPPIEDPFFIWLHLEELFPILTIEEMGLISRNIFLKKLHGLTHPNMMFILEKLCEEVKHCNEMALIDVIKGLQFCLPCYQNQPALEKFQQSLANSADRFSTPVLLNSLKLGISRNTCNNDLLNITISRFKSDVNSHPISSFGLLAQILSSFNISDAELFELITERINNTSDLDNKGSIVWIIYNLVLLNHIPEELISKILSSEFQKGLAHKQYELAKKLSVFLDLTLEIERPDYVGSRLPENSKKLLKNMSYGVLSCKKYNFSRHIYTLEEMAKRFAGMDNAVFFKLLLPNFALANIVVKLDKNLKGQEIPESYKSQRFPLEVTKPPDNDHHWLAIRLCKVQQMGLNDEMSAEVKCCDRQLRKVGYIPVVIKFKEWVSLKNEEPLQLELLENNIKEALGYK